MSLSEQRAQLETRRAALVARWAKKEISLEEFRCGINILCLSICMLDNTIETVNANRDAAAITALSQDMDG